MVLTNGETTIELPFAPVLQEYVVAPFARRVADEPAQMLKEGSDKFGVGFTLTADVRVAVQPRVELPLTV